MSMRRRGRRAKARRRQARAGERLGSRAGSTAGQRVRHQGADRGPPARASSRARATATNDPRQGSIRMPWQVDRQREVYVGNIPDALIAAEPPARTPIRRTPRLIWPSSMRRAGGQRRSLEFPPTGAGHHQPRFVWVFRGCLRHRLHRAASVSTEAEASAKDIAAIIRRSRSRRYRRCSWRTSAIRAWCGRSRARPAPRSADALFRRADGRQGDAPSYIELIRHNLKQLAAAWAKRANSE